MRKLKISLKLSGASDPEPGSFVGSGQGRALTGLSPKGLRATQSGGQRPGAIKPIKKGPPV